MKPGRTNHPDDEFSRVPDIAFGIRPGVVFIKKGDQKLTLDQPGAVASDVLMQDGKSVQFALDLSAAKVQESAGKLGQSGQASGNPGACPGFQYSADASDRSLRLVPESFAFRARNTRTLAPADVHIDRVTEQQHKFNASLVERRRSPMTCGASTAPATTGEKTMS